MAAFVYNYAKKQITTGAWNIGTDTVKAMLCEVTTSADSATAAGKDATTIGNINTLAEFTGSGYTAGNGGSQRTVANMTVNQDNTNDLAWVNGDDVSWAAPNAGNKIQGVLLYRVSGTLGQSNPLAWLDFATSFNANGGKIKISWSSNGIIRLTD